LATARQSRTALAVQFGQTVNEAIQQFRASVRAVMLSEQFRVAQAEIGSQVHYQLRIGFERAAMTAWLWPCGRAQKTTSASRAAARRAGRSFPDQADATGRDAIRAPPPGLTFGQGGDRSEARMQESSRSSSPPTRRRRRPPARAAVRLPSCAVLS
jgi:hypothetical protein